MIRLVFCVAVAILGGVASAQQSPSPLPFHPRPLPDTPHPATMEKVRNFWISWLPLPRQPSIVGRDYAFQTGQYRKRIEEYNCLVDRIRSGEFDCEVEKAMLRHNIRLAERLRRNEEAAELRDRLRFLETGVPRPPDGGGDLRQVVVEQARIIAELRAEIETLKRRPR